jgi:hypothetical protein
MGFVELGTSCVFRDNAGEGMKKVVASCAKTLDLGEQLTRCNATEVMGAGTGGKKRRLMTLKNWRLIIFLLQITWLVM